MRQSRKQTAWKKSRTFGDVKGGRKWPKLKDNIVKRKHSLLKPSEFDKLPIYMVENPSKDFYFPITIDDIKNVLAQLPPEHVEGLTHIWLRKTNKKEKYQGGYTVGSGVRLITLYPFPKSNQLILGKERPTHKLLTWYKGYASEPQKKKIIGILNLQKKAQEGIIWNVCYCTRLDIMLTRHWFVIRQPDINQRIVLIIMLLI